MTDGTEGQARGQASKAMHTKLHTFQHLMRSQSVSSHPHDPADEVSQSFRSWSHARLPAAPRLRWAIKEAAFKQTMNKHTYPCLKGALCSCQLLGDALGEGDRGRQTFNTTFQITKLLTLHPHSSIVTSSDCPLSWLLIVMAAFRLNAGPIDLSTCSSQRAGRTP